MKVSKSLLSAMLIGLTIGLTSCEDESMIVEEQEVYEKFGREELEQRTETDETCEEDTRPHPGDLPPGWDWGDCPACGLG